MKRCILVANHRIHFPGEPWKHFCAMHAKRFRSHPDCHGLVIEKIKL